MKINSELKKAVERLQAKEFLGAYKILRSIIEHEPLNSAANELMGLTLAQSGRAEESKQFFNRALSLNENNHHLMFNYANICRDTKEHKTSITLMRKAISISPNTDDYWVLLALNCSDIEECEASLYAYHRSLSINPRHEIANVNIIVLIAQHFGNEYALLSIERDKNFFKHSWRARYVYATILYKSERYEEASEAYSKLIDETPESDEILLGLAMSLHRAGKIDQALSYFEIASNKNPKNAKIWCNYGVALIEKEAHTKALNAFDQAIYLNPDYSEAFLNKAVALYELVRFDESLIFYEQALKLDPLNSNIHRNFAVFNFYLERFENGWFHYSHRWGIPEEKKLDDKFIKNLKINEKILIAEQGIGDQIMYLSVMSDVDIIDFRPTICVNAKLVSVLSRSIPRCNFLSLEKVSSFSEEDTIPLVDYVATKRKTAHDFLINRKAYLLPDKRYSDKIRSDLRVDKRFVVGICWRSINNEFGFRKSARLSDFAPLFQLSEFAFLNLQYGNIESDLQDLKNASERPLQVVPNVDLFNDIEDVVALIDNCDFIITVSNSVAHIAAAMGKRVFLMLSKAKGRFWYWETLNNRCLWYTNVHIFRQKTQGEWSEVVTRISLELQATISESRFKD